MPSGEWSAASARVKPATAALVVSYCRLPPPALLSRLSMRWHCCAGPLTKSRHAASVPTSARVKATNKGAVAQAGMRRDIDAVEQRPRFRRIEHRRLPGGHDVTGPSHCVRRVDRHDLAVDQPVE